MLDVFSLLLNLLAESEVHKFVHSVVDHDIIWFEVPVDDFSPVKLLYKC